MFDLNNSAMQNLKNKSNFFNKNIVKNLKILSMKKLNILLILKLFLPFIIGYPNLDISNLPSPLKNVVNNVSQEISIFTNPTLSNQTFDLLEQNYKELIEAEENKTNLINLAVNKISVLSNIYLIELIFERTKSENYQILKFIYNIFGYNYSFNYLLCLTLFQRQKYNEIVHKHLERETGIYCSPYKFNKTAKIVKDNFDLIQEGNYIINRQSFQNYLSLMDDNKLNITLERFFRIFGRGRTHSILKIYQELFLPVNKLDPVSFSYLYSHYFETNSIVEKWRMKVVIDEYIYKEWIEEYKKENRSDKRKLEGIDEYWNKIFENYWSKDRTLQNCEDSNDQEYEKELLEQVFLNSKNYALTRLENPNFLQFAKDEFIEEIAEKTRKTKKGKPQGIKRPDRGKNVQNNRKMHAQKLIKLIKEKDNFNLKEEHEDLFNENIKNIIQNIKKKADSLIMLTDIENFNKLNYLVQTEKEIGNNNLKNIENINENLLKAETGIIIKEHGEIIENENVLEKEPIKNEIKEQIEDNKIINELTTKIKVINEESVSPIKEIERFQDSLDTTKKSRRKKKLKHQMEQITNSSKILFNDSEKLSLQKESKIKEQKIESNKEIEENINESEYEISLGLTKFYLEKILGMEY
ncbi:hypothetical protein Mgra_00008097 [Meloidogyne graminicola]|uniref:Uncharacterized protein n=1 Tax=Meloidogyne graminicola TaxID=189291 RepID=A0A8S9ZGY5_9BILA|nr:hypothetical protein Mgra_00008097 [Meloidogyne graminicola]